MNKKTAQAYVLLLLATSIWGGNLIVGKVAITYLPPFTLSLLRWSLAFLVMLPFTWKMMKNDWKIIRQYIPIICILSSTGIVGYSTTLYFALNYTSSINVAVLNSITPVFIVIFTFFFLRETLKIVHGCGIMLSVFGILFIITKGSWEALLSFQFNVGDLLVILAMIFWSIYSIFIKKYVEILPKYSSFSFIVLIALLPLSCLSFWEMNYSVTVMVWDGDLLFILAYIGILAAIVPFLAWSTAIGLVGATVSGVFYNLIPLFSTIFAIVFLKESLTWFQLVGGGLVILGVLVSSINAKQKSISESNIQVKSNSI
jgi:drug/metabolite transporter (DMT)-like permease